MGLPQKRISVGPNDKIVKISKSLRKALLIMEGKRQSTNRKTKSIRPEGGTKAKVSPRVKLEPGSRGRQCRPIMDGKAWSK